MAQRSTKDAQEQLQLCRVMLLILYYVISAVYLGENKKLSCSIKLKVRFSICLFKQNAMKAYESRSTGVFEKSGANGN
jgi:hypothetical protein